MTRFQFRLARVKEYRLHQFEAANEALHRLIGEREALQEAKEALGRQYSAEETALCSAASPQPEEHTALAAYRRYILAEQARREAKIQECERRIDKQRAETLEARRRYRLLERLYEKRRSEWEATFAKETDALAEESYLARWDSHSGSARQPERPDPFV